MIAALSRLPLRYWYALSVMAGPALGFVLHGGPF